MADYPYNDSAGIGRQVDEKAVLSKLQDNPHFTEKDFTDEEVSFIRSCRFYDHTPIQGDIVRIAAQRNIGHPFGTPIVYIHPPREREVPYTGENMPLRPTPLTIGEPPNVACDRTILIEAVETWGVDAQVLMAIEECSELITELSHFLRGRDANVIEEIADVLIVVEQMKIVFSVDAVNRAIEEKMDRLRHKLDEYKTQTGQST